jgi:tetratricopeptide (TPR) repeat protein
MSRIPQLSKARFGENRAGEDRTGEAGFPVGDRTSRRLGNYIRRLREGYGYTLRRVEERALALGEIIDNSQLSRFEKGKAIPSFEKLRALARIFNVSVQTFSDVLDLEEYEAFKPSSSDFEDLLRDGAGLMAAGEHGKAFVTFERALEVSEASDNDPGAAERQAEAHWAMVTALRALGKLSMTERELREILRIRGRLGRRTQVRSLLELSYVYRELGDLYVASILARECLDLALAEGDVQTHIGVLNTLGNIYHEENNVERALGYYRRALEVLESLEGHDKIRVTLLTNLGGCLVDLSRYEEGVERLKEAYERAVSKGYRRTAALALTRLGEAHLARGDKSRAMEKFAESDALASRPDESYQDILFLNAYRRWETARSEGNSTREKIAFGRLRHLRSLLERKFPEVVAFDRYVERTRRHYAHP